MWGLLRRSLPAAVQRARPRHFLFAAPPMAALWLGQGRKPEPAPRCEESVLVPLPPLQVSGLQLLFRLLQLSFWLIPVSFLFLTGALRKDSDSDIGPAILARCLEGCGPTFVKLGQWLATRRDLLSEKSCQQLGRLQEGVQASFRIEEEELRQKCANGGLQLTNVECSRPIGKGCVSQVYSAELEDGRRVAVKLRRPKVREQVAMDVALMRMLGAVVERCWKDLQWLSLQEGISAFSRDMEKQLDFRIEAQNMLRLRANFQHHRHMRVPEVHHSSEDVLVTTFVAGQSLSELLQTGASNLSDAVRSKLWYVLGHMVSKMVFADNFVHQDLHPGNIRISFSTDPAVGSRSVGREHGESEGFSPVAYLSSLVETAKLSWPFGKTPMEVYLLDAGLAASLPSQKVGYLAEVVKGGVCGRPDAAGAAFLEVHEKQGLANFAVMKDEFARLVGLLAQAAMITQNDWAKLGFETEAQYKNSRLDDYFGRVAKLFAKHQIRMDHEIWSLLTSFALIEGSMQELSGNKNVMRCVLPYVVSGSFTFFLQGLQALSTSEKLSALQQPVHEA